MTLDLKGSLPLARLDPTSNPSGRTNADSAKIKGWPLASTTYEMCFSKKVAEEKNPCTPACTIRTCRNSCLVCVIVGDKASGQEPSITAQALDRNAWWSAGELPSPVQYEVISLPGRPRSLTAMQSSYEVATQRTKDRRGFGSWLYEVLLHGAHMNTRTHIPLFMNTYLIKAYMRCSRN